MVYGIVLPTLCLTIPGPPFPWCHSQTRASTRPCRAQCSRSAPVGASRGPWNICASQVGFISLFPWTVTHIWVLINNRFSVGQTIWVWMRIEYPNRMCSRVEISCQLKKWVEHRTYGCSGSQFLQGGARKFCLWVFDSLHSHSRPLTMVIVIWLVVWTPLKNMTSSVGMIINYSQYDGTNQSHVPNHQPDNSWTIVGLIVGIMVIMVNYYIFMIYG